MLKIRLQRIGRKKITAFRVVVTESQNSTKSGKFLEIIGSYDPVKKVKEIDAERVRYWISKGAKPSETIHNFLIDQKIISAKKINKLPVKSKTLKRKELKAAAGKKDSVPVQNPVAPGGKTVEKSATAEPVNVSPTPAENAPLST